MSETTIFTQALLIDGNGRDPRPDTTVVVEGDRIREILPDTGKHTAGHVIALGGRTLMPGLIDAHVHPGNLEFSLAKTAALPPAVYVHRTTRNLERDLQMGFTCLRDAGGLDDGFRRAADQGLIAAPRLFLSVTPLVQSGGSGVVQPRNSLGVCPEVCDGPDAVRAAARRTLGRGADQIKIFADGEVVAQDPSDRHRPGQWKFSVPEIRAAVEAAEAAGSYVMAHTYCARAVMNCLQAGVRSIEHGNLIDAETVDALAASDSFYVPTLAVFEAVNETGDRAGLDAFARRKLRQVADRGRQALEMAYRAGARIGCGSDLIGPLQHLKGRELAIRAEIQLPMEVIVSATRTNAELLGVADRMGTVEAGKWADMIVTDVNPIEDMGLFENAMERVVLVMRNGQIVKNLLPG